MLLAMQTQSGATLSDAITKDDLYATLYGCLVLTAFLAIVTVIRCLLVRSRRRAHKPDNVPVS